MTRYSTSYANDITTVPRERATVIYQQSKILDRAISAADAILYPHKSLLDLSTVVARKFQSMHANIIGHRHQFRPCQPYVTDIFTDNSFLVPPKLLDGVIQMWAWFQDNEDVLFRISLTLARLPIDNIVDILTAPSMSAPRDNVDPMLLRDPRTPLSPPPDSSRINPWDCRTRSDPIGPQFLNRPVYTNPQPVYSGSATPRSTNPGPEPATSSKEEERKTKKFKYVHDEQG